MYGQAQHTTERFNRSLLPPARTFYEREFGSSLGCEHRGWAQTKCVFNNGQSKTSLSLNMAEGGLFCFSCQAKGGGIVDFVMLRDNVDFKRAAQTLGTWGPLTTSTTEWQHQRTQLRREQEAREAKALAEKRQRHALRDDIHQSSRLMREISGQLRDMPEGPDKESLWHALQLAWENRELSEREYMRLAGLEVAHEW